MSDKNNMMRNIAVYWKRFRIAYGYLLLLSLSFAVVGCGFHLHGNAGQLLPPEVPLFIDAKPTLRATLMLYLPSDQWQDQAQSGTLTLWVGDEKFSQRILSIDPSTGNESEIALHYSVFFMLQRADGHLFLEKQRLDIMRDIVRNTGIMNRNHEVALLHKAMRQQAMFQIANQIKRSLSP